MKPAEVKQRVQKHLDAYYAEIGAARALDEK